MALPAEFGAAQAVELFPNILKLDEYDKRSTNRWGSPQNLARNLLMANATLQFLFHPNVFNEPATEGARIFNLLYAEACLQEKKDAFRVTFPMYVTEHRNLGKIHPPLPEIPGILDQFWDGSMERYRTVFKIKRDPTKKKIPGKDGEPRKLKPLVQKIIEIERRRKREEAKAAAIAKLREQSTADSNSPLVALTKSTLDTVKGSGSPSSKRAATWGVFNKMLHPGKPRRQGKSVGNDGSIDEETFDEKIVGGDVLGTQILDSMSMMAPAAEPISTNMPKEKHASVLGTQALKGSTTIFAPGEIPLSTREMEEQEITIHHKTANIYEDYICLAEHVEYVEGQPQISEDSVLRKMNELSKTRQVEDEGPHEEFQRLKLLKDGSMEVSVSVDEAEEEAAN